MHGVNHGSLAERMLFTYGDTPEGMVESVWNLFCESLDFAIWSSPESVTVPVMLAAYRLMAQRMDALGMDYPCIWASRKPVMVSMVASSLLLGLPHLADGI